MEWNITADRGTDSLSLFNYTFFFNGDAAVILSVILLTQVKSIKSTL